MALTSATLVKSYLNESGSSVDSIIATFIAAVEARILAYLARTRVETGSVSNEYHDGDGRSHQLLLREWPATTVSSVEWWNGTTATALSASDYVLQDASDSGPGILIYTPGGGSPAAWPEGLRNIRVSYTAGHASTPKDIELAATIQVVWDLQRRGLSGAKTSGQLGVRQNVIGDNTAIYLVDAWAPEVLAALEPHRRRYV